ncbi:MAG: hypothetical protein IPM59_05745 [Chloracidobacterium sp.]|nr:hypothetical protein [Chloracidobacterium sp.]
MLRTASFLVLMAIVSAACGPARDAREAEDHAVQTPSPDGSPSPSPTPAVPDLQAELTDDRNTATVFPIGAFDFKNYTYELPRGWQNPDGTAEIILKNGKAAPVGGQVSDGLSNDARAVAKAERRIGLSFVTAKYFDLTGDGEDEAVVVLKIETGGSAVPQIGYVFAWKNGAPELIWQFRTGDRADGGLKNLFAENGMLAIELFGQDRFILGQVETGRITGDEEQLCCPTHFTRSAYKWNGSTFILQGKRHTYSIADNTLPAQENLGDMVNEPAKKKK